MKTAAAAAGILTAMLLGGVSRADSIYSSDFQGGPDVEFEYTTGYKNGNPNKPRTDEVEAEAGAFRVTPTDSSTPAFDAYCASLGISNPAQDPVNLIVASTSPLNQMHKGDGGLFKYSEYEDVGNRLAYLLQTHGGDSDPLAKAALALAVWNTIDKNFSYGYEGNSHSEGSALRSLFNSFVDFSNYDETALYGPNAVYLHVEYADTNKGHKPYQDLVAIVPTNPDTQEPGGPAVPEPASVISILIGMGSAGLFASRRAYRKTA